MSSDQPVKTAQVLLPLAMEDSYTYRVPEGMGVEPGSLVEVPLGPRHYLACVWDDAPGPLRPGVRLKEIAGVAPGPPLPRVLRRFVDWVAGYTLTPRGMILRMVLRAPEALLPEAPVTLLKATGTVPSRMTAARERVLEVLAERDEGLEKAQLAAEAGVSPGVIDGLVKLGAIAREKVVPAALEPPLAPDHRPARLSDDQAAALAALRGQKRGFAATLLDGVTGSGKTAVYLELVADVLRTGGQALVLLPEIALTESFLQRFAERFGARPITWHSGLTPRQRERAWRRVYLGEARVVVGARSGLFLPFADLRLIVVDEEHESAYKQEERGVYHARDMAVKRAQLSDCPIVLASATPSLETWANVQAGRYAHVNLPWRFSGQAEPRIAAIDMRGERLDASHWLSEPLKQAVAERLGRGEQALLFLNRRGYAPLTLCRACGHRLKCPHCTAWLTEHRFRRQLLCHHCGHFEPTPTLCPSCGAENTLVPCGPGVERLAEEARAAFADARMLVLSSDLMASPADMRRELLAVEEGRVDLVIGTQVLAKGHHFPRLTLVGVVDADLGLEQADPRAGERTFQLLHQVIGRAGRAEAAGEGLLQSYNPEHPVLQALIRGDRDAFYREELALRRRAGMPPFGRLAAIIISSTDKARALAHARALVRAAPAAEGAQVLGPAEAPIAQLRGRYRFRLLVKAPRSFDLQGFLRGWLQAGPRPAGDTRVLVDVDPQSFL